MKTAYCGVTVKSHNQLPKITEQQLRTEGAKAIECADRGIQTALVGEDGKTVRAVIGMNGVRYLPDPDIDPLEEMMLDALETKRQGTK
jgi:hypothetical protein